MTLTTTKTAEQVVKEMPFAQQNRARGLYERGQEEGAHKAAYYLENLIYENAQLNDGEILQLIAEWIKEMKEVQ